MNDSSAGGLRWLRPTIAAGVAGGHASWGWRFGRAGLQLVVDALGLPGCSLLLQSLMRRAPSVPAEE